MLATSRLGVTLAFTLAATLTCASAPVPPPAKPERVSPGMKDDPRAVERVRARYAEVNGAIEGARAQASFLGADSEHYDVGPWRAVKSEAECWVVPEDTGENYERFPTGCATVWRLDGKVVRTRISTTSPSGDWMSHVEYTFWPDGRVAFRFAEHRAAVCVVPGEGEEQRVDDCGQDEREYRDERGTLVRTRVERWGRRGGKRVVMPEVSFPYDSETPHYTRLTELPFAKQLE